jgi:asparagine N-glycosylation enzyme membrane subunit Stt3
MDDSSTAVAGSRKKTSFFSLDNKVLFTIIFIALIALLIYMRSGLAAYQGLFEPDGFFDYAVLQQAVAHGFIVSDHLALSGFPTHNFIGEPQGEYYITLLPYAILQFFGVSLISLMRAMPVVTGIIEAILIYLLAQYVSKSKSLGLLSVLFLALSSGNVARTALLVYRGDTFITPFIMAALLLMLMFLSTENKKKRYSALVASAVVLALGTSVWNGAAFTFVIYFTAMLLMLIYAFGIANKKLLRDVLLLSGASIITFIVSRLLILADLTRAPTFTGLDFFGLYLPMVIGAAGAYYLVSDEKKMKFVQSPSTRIALVFIAIITVVIIAGTLYSGYIAHISNVGQGTSGIGQSTQELQPPTYSFLFASFGYELFLAPIGVLLFLLIADRSHHATRHRIGDISINANYGFLAMLAYLLITVYLQAGAIRYNSLLSIPMALFAAYSIYIIGRVLYDQKYALFGKVQLSYIFYALFIVLIYLHFQIAYSQSFSSAQADGVNQQFLDAVTWMRSNIPLNATVLTLWPDGSVVEGWGNRTSYMDSVGGETGSRIYNFTDWLFNTTPDTQYLYNNHKPQYLLVRQYWWMELGGIAEEGAPINVSAFAYSPLGSVNVQQGQNNTVIYNFLGSYRVQMLVTQQNATAPLQFFAFIGSTGSSQGAMLKHIVLLNQANETYDIINSNSVNAVNYTLFVTFYGKNITGAAVLGSMLPESNIYKMLILCNYQVCPYATPNATMQVVYENMDTKILKISYAH